MRTAVDTNIILALWSAEPLAGRAEAALMKARKAGSLVICGVVYAELAAHPNSTANFVTDFLRNTEIEADFSTTEAMWNHAAIANARQAERRRKLGKREPKRLVADFMIGAHAVVAADRLLTADINRYKSSFPHLVLMDL